MTAPDALTALISRLATEICVDVCELPDRSSPDDWPEACLVTSEELHDIVTSRLVEGLDGSRLLPVELTDVMRKAGAQYFWQSEDDVAEGYRVMLAAHPSATDNRAPVEQSRRPLRFGYSDGVPGTPEYEPGLSYPAPVDHSDPAATDNRAPVSTPAGEGEGVYQSAADCPLGPAHGMASTHGNAAGEDCCDFCGFPAQPATGTDEGLREAARRVQQRVGEWDRLPADADRTALDRFAEVLRHDAMTLVVSALSADNRAPADLEALAYQMAPAFLAEVGWTRQIAETVERGLVAVFKAMPARENIS